MLVLRLPTIELTYLDCAPKPMDEEVAKQLVRLKLLAESNRINTAHTSSNTKVLLSFS